MATVGFSQILNEKPSFFVDLVWQGILEGEACTSVPFTANGRLESFYRHYRDYFQTFGKNWDAAAINYSPKLHTIRSNKNGYYKKGMFLHPVVNNRSKNRFQFAPVLKCTGTQRIHMEGEDLFVDFKRVNRGVAKTISRIDGFPLLHEFIQWMKDNDDGNLVIVHWSKLKY